MYESTDAIRRKLAALLICLLAAPTPAKTLKQYDNIILQQ